VESKEPDSRTRQKEILEWLKDIRNAGIVLGFPILIAIGLYLHNQQVSIYQAQIRLLEQSQYDKAYSIIRAQKELFPEERERLGTRISRLDSLVTASQAEKQFAESVLWIFYRDQFERLEQQLSSLGADLPATVTVHASGLGRTLEEARDEARKAATRVAIGQLSRVQIGVQVREPGKPMTTAGIITSFTILEEKVSTLSDSTVNVTIQAIVSGRTP